MYPSRVVYLSWNSSPHRLYILSTKTAATTDNLNPHIDPILRSFNEIIDGFFICFSTIPPPDAHISSARIRIRHRKFLRGIAKISRSHIVVWRTESQRCLKTGSIPRSHLQPHRHSDPDRIGRSHCSEQLFEFAYPQCCC